MLNRMGGVAEKGVGVSARPIDIYPTAIMSTNENKAHPHWKKRAPPNKKGGSATANDKNKKEVSC